MLVECKECKGQISDKAYACPHCGYPLKPVKQERRSTKRKRLPNGFGQITFIKGNLRKPYRAMVTVGAMPNGRPRCELLKPVAYFETYNEAYKALMDRKSNSYDQRVTFKELYERWSPTYFEKMKNSKNHKAAWKYLEPIHNSKLAETKAYHLKECILNSGASDNTKRRMKVLLSKLYEYAMEYELIDKNYAKLFSLDLDLDAKTKHIPYTKEEIDALFNHARYNDVAAILAVQCYSGWRPGELASLKTENVDIKNWFFVGGTKTKAGTDRIVPIHEKIRGIVESAYKAAKKHNSPTLFFILNVGEPIPYGYRILVTKLKHLKNEIHINPEHRLHDGRKHFVTMAKRWNVDEYAIKRIVGHAIEDLTEEVYTERSKEWLAQEMGKIKE